MLLWAALLVLTCLPPAAAAEPVFRIDCPERARPGEAFPCTLRSRLDFTRVTLRWLDRTVPLELEDGQETVTGSLLLGSDVKTLSRDAATVFVTGYRDGLSVSSSKQVRFEEADFPVQRLHLPESKVSLSQEALDRHRREKAAVSRALSVYTPDGGCTLPLHRPVPGEVSSVYGVKRILNGKPRSPHRGVDFRTGQGKPIEACERGTVVLTGEHFFAGKSVYLHHGQGAVSMYFHLSEILVREGETVARGQPVGLSGQSGRSTGPHLHFGLSLMGQLVNPLPLLTEGS